jgi:hypothetical protein
MLVTSSPWAGSNAIGRSWLDQMQYKEVGMTIMFLTFLPKNRNGKETRKQKHKHKGKEFCETEVRRGSFKQKWE